MFQTNIQKFSFHINFKGRSHTLVSVETSIKGTITALFYRSVERITPDNVYKINRRTLKKLYEKKSAKCLVQ